MKKVLALLASISLTAPAAAGVVSCGAPIDHDVLLVLPGDVMGSSSRITKSYEAVAQEFNNTPEMKNSNTKIKVLWEDADAVQERASSFQELPDLYVENPDSVSKYAYGFETGDQVRDMAKSAELTSDEIDKQYWGNSFGVLGKSGSIDNPSPQVLALSLLKSFDMSVVNMRILTELLTISGAQNLQGDPSEKTNIFDGVPNTDSDDANTIKTNWDALTIPEGANVKNDTDKFRYKVREFFKSDENVLAMASLYSSLYSQARNDSSIVSRWASQGINNKNRLFPIGIDDVPNKIMYEYSDDTVKKNAEGGIDGIVDTTDTNTKFLYSVSQINPDKESMHIEINNSGNGYDNSNDFFTKINSLRVNAGDTDKVQSWAGAMIIAKIDGKTYTSSYFNQGTMLEASSSSAGTWAFNNKGTSGPTKFDLNKDLIVVGGASGTAKNYNFMSQGPELAGFKSVGPNKAQKEKIVTQFIKYLMGPSKLNELALRTGYIPSTKDALNQYIKYKEGNYDHGEKVPDGQYTSDNKYGEKDAMLSDFLNTYTTTLNKDKTITNQADFISNPPTPAGMMIRDAVLNIMINYVLSGKATYQQMYVDAKQLYSLKYYISTNELPDAFADAKVTYKKG